VRSRILGFSDKFAGLFLTVNELVYAVFKNEHGKGKAEK